MLDIKSGLNQLVVHPSFNETISEINKLNMELPPTLISEEMDFSLYPYPQEGKLISNLEEMKNYTLNAKNGEKLVRGNLSIAAYDESFRKYDALEGSSFLTTHSLILLHKNDFLPSCYLTFYFYTRSKESVNKSKNLNYSKNPDIDNTLNYVKDRSSFILKNVPNNSILFIDGPLLGGQISSYTIRLNEELLKKNIFPVFFVKNSSSSLVVENVGQLKDKYNSDLHWAYKSLKKGERTNLFKYEDIYNKKNAKIFCYMKTYDVGPQRIEIHYQKVAEVKDAILERQRERMSEEQIAKLEQVFNKIKEKARAMETKTESKKQNVKTKYKALAGKTDAEVEAVESEIDEETGLTAGRLKRAEKEITNAEKALTKAKERIREEKAEGTDVTEIEQKVEEIEQQIENAKTAKNTGKIKNSQEIAEELKDFGNEVSALATRLREAKQAGNFDEAFTQMKATIRQRHIEHMSEVLEKVPEKAKEAIQKRIEAAQQEQVKVRVKASEGLEAEDVEADDDDEEDEDKGSAQTGKSE